MLPSGPGHSRATVTFSKPPEHSTSRTDMTDDKPMWMVRAGRSAVDIDHFMERSRVAMGWREIGDLTQHTTRKSVVSLVASQWPEYSKGKTTITAGQLYRFSREIAVGDWVITYDAGLRQYPVGRVTSEYRFEPEQHYAHVRDVEWINSVSRDDLSITTRNSIGAISTLFLLPDVARDELLALHTGVVPSPAHADEDDLPEDEDELLEDVEEKAREFIKDQLMKLDWEQMQQLVAGILRAMGYKTRVSAAGPDQGKDIVASPDGLGFEHPRIVVEVKHRVASMGSNQIRSFLGGRHKDDRGLYVSTGGFSKDARYEAERASIPLTLLDAGGLVDVLIENYEELDIETKQLVPLKRLYWPS